MARSIRKSPLAFSLYCALKNTWLPAAFLTLALAFIFAIVNKATFEVANSIGQICPAPAGEPEGDKTGEKRLDEKTPVVTSSFEAQSPCTDTQVYLDKDVAYYIRVTIDKNNPWYDGKSSADVRGVASADFGEWAAHYGGTLLKRWWGEPYFQTIARIGLTGNDEYVLKSLDPSQSEFTSLTARITPRNSGRLYLYVNDAVLGLPWIYDYFYSANNRGKANVEIWEAEPKQPEPPVADRVVESAL